MTECSCRHCIFVFNLAVILNTGLLGLLLTFYAFFGNMPPAFSMIFGFWILFIGTFFGTYCVLLSSAIFFREKDVPWTRNGFIGTAICFALGAILLFVPLTPGGMLYFSDLYFKVYKEIPPFLDNMQVKFQCCGINDYRDYATHITNTSYGIAGFMVFRKANPNDDFFHYLVEDFTLNRTVSRSTTGLDVPQSCCPAEKALNVKDVNCGKQVEYTGAPIGTDLYTKQEASAKQKVNNPKLGCYEKYKKILGTGYQFQLAFLLASIQYLSVIQSVLFCFLVWLHRISLRNIRQIAYWLPRLIHMHDDIEAARAHAQLEAEADASHHDSEHKAKRTKSGSDRENDSIKSNKSMKGEKKKSEKKSIKKDQTHNSNKAHTP